MCFIRNCGVKETSGGCNLHRERTWCVPAGSADPRCARWCKKQVTKAVLVQWDLQPVTSRVCVVCVCVCVWGGGVCSSTAEQTHRARSLVGLALQSQARSPAPYYRCWSRPQRAHSLAPRLLYSIWISAPSVRLFLPTLPVRSFVTRRKDVNETRACGRIRRRAHNQAQLLREFQGLCLHPCEALINKLTGEGIKEKHLNAHFEPTNRNF